MLDHSNQDYYFWIDTLVLWNQKTETKTTESCPLRIAQCPKITFCPFITNALSLASRLFDLYSTQTYERNNEKDKYICWQFYRLSASYISRRWLTYFDEEAFLVIVMLSNKLQMLTCMSMMYDERKSEQICIYIYICIVKNTGSDVSTTIDITST